MSKKSFAKGDGTKVLLATAVGFALIFGLATNGLKLRDKPPSWKITGERYGVDWQFRFGKSKSPIVNLACSGSCAGTVVQRNNLGLLYYERELIATWPAFPSFVPNGEAKVRLLFSELD